MSPAPLPSRERWLWLCAGLLFLACMPALLRTLFSVPMCASQDYNEGWNALHVDSLSLGLPLYRPLGDPYHNNYPPLAFHPTEWLLPLVSDPMLAGRVLGLAAFAACCALCGALVRAWGGSRALAAACAMFTLAVFLAHSHYVGINDPQMLGHALALAGLVCIARPGRTTLAVCLGAALLAASGFVKHNLVVLPLTLAIWLWLHDRRRMLAYAGCGLLVAALLWALFGWLHGWDFMRHLFAPRDYEWNAMWHGNLVWLAKGAPLLVPLAVAAWRQPRDPALSLAALWAGIGVLTGGYFIGGWGVDQNVFFDAYFAGAFGTAMVWRQLQSMPGDAGSTRRFQAALAACALAPLLVSAGLRANAGWLRSDYWVHPRLSESVAEVARSRAVVRTREQGDCGRPVQCYQSRILRDHGALACRAD